LDAASSGGVNPLEMNDLTLTDSLSENTDDLGADSLLASLEAGAEPDTLEAFFRKQFNLSSKPIDGWIAIAGDKSYRLYINDVYITGKESGPFEQVEKISFATFADFIREGDNVIAVSLKDFDGPPRYGLRMHLDLKLLPGEISETIESIRSKMDQDRVDPQILKKSTILNKNRIVE
ncbi:MAG: hypothetical protein KDG51_02080, partial [Calditrichaeota bacterium]|nr:hypothetical protein [Calditrichota bacterium]